MPFLELSLVVRLEQQPSVEDALEELGALSITLRDADAETPDEQAIFEPGVGELPLWSTITLNALFEADADRRGLTEALGEFLPWLEPDQLSFAEVADQDWERAWMDQFQPMPFGRRLWIYPWNIEPPADEDIVVVRLDPGLAFGSGTHPTTALCLEWLDGLDLAGKTGHRLRLRLRHPRHRRAQAGRRQRRGRGQRSAGAHRLGRQRRAQCRGRPAEGIPAAGFRRRTLAQRGADVSSSPTSSPARSASSPPPLPPRRSPGAPFAISGILAGQQDELLQRYAEWFDELRVDTREDWVRISGRRR